MKKLSSFFFFLLFASNQLYSQNTLRVPSEFLTIQSAIDSSQDGNLVLIEEGEYFEDSFNQFPMKKP